MVLNTSSGVYIVIDKSAPYGERTTSLTVIFPLSDLTPRVMKPARIITARQIATIFLLVFTFIVFLLFSEKSGRKYLGIIQDESVAFSEIISNVFENLVLYLACVLVKNHHAAFISPFAGRFMGNVILQGNRKLEL